MVEQLSNDVLLMVMEHLRVEDLFACRLVCKRLGALALHPGVWRRQSCDGLASAGGGKAVCRVLRVAPRLHKLILWPEAMSPHLSYQRTTCAVRELELFVGANTAVLGALVVRNQEALGRLRRVALYLHGLVRADAGALFGMLASSPILKKLEIKDLLGGQVLFADAPSCAVGASSLEYFQCVIRSGSEDFVNFVLAGHASTLKVVDLGKKGYVTARSSSTASLLAGVTNLHQLTCPLLPAMEDLAASESLTKLELHVSSAMRFLGPAAAKFLRRARHLRDVTLRYTSDNRFPADVGVDLVGALAGGISGVENLTIKNEFSQSDKYSSLVEGDIYPDLGPLARALPSMRALKYLVVDVYGVPEVLLEAITPDTAPALRSLILEPAACAYRYRQVPRCGHAWTHEDSIQNFGSLNCPKIDLEIDCERERCDEGDMPYCEFCKHGCCQEGIIVRCRCSLHL